MLNYNSIVTSNPHVAPFVLLFQSGAEEYFSIFDISDALLIAKELLNNGTPLHQLRDSFISSIFSQYDLPYEQKTMYYNLELRTIVDCVTTISERYYNDVTLLLNDIHTDTTLFDKSIDDIQQLYGMVDVPDDFPTRYQAKMLLANTVPPCNSTVTTYSEDARVQLVCDSLLGSTLIK
jgi:hypothetical protein